MARSMHNFAGGRVPAPPFPAPFSWALPYISSRHHSCWSVFDKLESSSVTLSLVKWSTAENVSCHSQFETWLRLSLTTVVSAESFPYCTGGPLWRLEKDMAESKQLMGPVFLWLRPGWCVTLSSDALPLMKLSDDLSRLYSADDDDVVQWLVNVKSLNLRTKEGEMRCVCVCGCVCTCARVWCTDGEHGPDVNVWGPMSDGWRAHLPSSAESGSLRTHFTCCPACRPQPCSVGQLWVHDWQVLWCHELHSAHGMAGSACHFCIGSLML